MGKKKKRGVCCICGKNGELSFEHVPPKAAYNKATVIEYELENYSQRRKSKGRSHQGGMGAYTLCEECNNNTGSWYGKEYVKWARMCNDAIKYWNIRNINFGSCRLKNVYPLRFLKQVATCFFSLSGVPGIRAYGNDNADLVRFVLDKPNTYLPSGIRFFMNFYPYSSQRETHLRRWTLASKISVQTVANGNLIPINSNSFDEISHPPFQLVMTQDNEPFQNATEITNFKNYAYDQQTNIDMFVRIVNSNIPYPGAG